MLRTTVTKLLETKLSKKTCVQCVDALHSDFSPKLTWVEKVTLIKKVSDYKFKSTRIKWNYDKLAEYLSLNYFHVLDSLRLADGLVNYPNLRYIKNRVLASKILRSEFPNNLIDGYMIEHNIRKEDQSVTE